MMRRLVREAALLLFLATVPAVVWAVLNVEREKTGKPLLANEVTATQVRDWEKVLWVDARPAAKFEAGHIPGAVRLDPEGWEGLIVAFFDAWDPDAQIVVYCDSAECDLSRGVADRLRDEVGLENVHVLHGGLQAWEAAR